VTDDHDRSVDAVERLQCWARSLLVVGARIVERHVRRDRAVTRCSQAFGDRLPARPVVPLTVDETERDQARGIAQTDVVHKRCGRSR
jgi:hypothetical protein